MKRFQRLAALSMALCLGASLFAGCGGSGGGQTQAAGESTAAGDSAAAGESTADSSAAGESAAQVSEEDKYGGTLNISLSSVPSNIDPVKYTGVYENQIIAQICDTLITYSDDLTEFVPCLATEWSANEAGDVYTFKLREDVYFQPGKFQDGRQMTADDVKYSLERSANESALDRLAMLDHCEVIDDFTIECHLTSPNASFLAALYNGGNVIVPKEEVEGWGDEFGAHLVGTGPFMMAEDGWKTDESCSLVRFDKYWGQKPYLDGVKFVYITDNNQRANALQTGEIDVACDLTGEAIQTVQNDSNLTMSQIPGMGVNYIYFNMKKGPTANIKVRQALQMAFDRDSTVAALYQYGEGQVGYLPLPPDSWGYDESLIESVPKYDPEGAKQLLAEAGYADGFTLEYYTGDSATSKRIGEIFQQFMAQIGVTVNIHQAAWGAFSEVGASGNADVIAMSWTWDPDPYFYLNKMFHKESLGSLGNGQQFDIPEVNELLDQAVAVSDQAERAEIYKQALKLIVEQYPQIDYAVTNVNTGLSKKVSANPVRADKTICLVSEGTTNIWKAK